MYDIYINRADTRRNVIIAVGAKMSTVVKMTNLDPNEVAWAIEEEGMCSTDLFTIVESCEECMHDTEEGSESVLPTSMLEDMKYVLLVDEVANFIMSRVKDEDEFASTLNLFAMQLQRECGYPLHPDDINPHGDTVQ